MTSDSWHDHPDFVLAIFYIICSGAFRNIEQFKQWCVIVMISGMENYSVPAFMMDLDYP